MGDLVHISDFMPARGCRIATDRQRQTTIPIATGFRDLDAILGGLQRGDLVTVAARPSLGKTSLLLNLARNAAARDCTVLFFSLEMAGKQLVQRLLAIESGLDSTKLTARVQSEREKRRIMHAQGVLGDLPIYLRDSAMMTMSDMRSMAERFQTENSLDLIIVDTIQDLSCGSRNGNSVEELSQLTRSLKQMARDLDVPALVSSPVSRAVESRAKHIPLLSDLRGSGSIEDESDVVIFLSPTDPSPANPRGISSHITRLTVGKNRNGPTGTIYLCFQKNLHRFEDLLVRQEEWEED